MAGDEIRISEFNELQFKMIRVHKLQDEINELWINPLLMNFTFGDYNYKLIISILENLYSEVHAKCQEGSKEKIKELFDSIENLVETKPPFEKGKHPTSKRVSLNKDNWKELRGKIKELNLHVRELLDKHGFSPDKDEDEGL